MSILLQHALPGTTYRIVSVEGAPESTQRIRELGLTVGAQCMVVRKSPFGGPVELSVGSRHLGIRLTQVDVLVEPCERVPHTSPAPVKQLVPA
ncbi:MAG: ferrous iron transport protein A [Bradyrhizobiaceae bacterium]|nr:ferrous iron transport protein A [Bradyrhizobiaceae bacterium]